MKLTNAIVLTLLLMAGCEDGNNSEEQNKVKEDSVVAVQDNSQSQVTTSNDEAKHTLATGLINAGVSIATPVLTQRFISGVDKISFTADSLVTGVLVENESTNQQGVVTGDIIVLHHKGTLLPDLEGFSIARLSDTRSKLSAQNNQVDLLNALKRLKGQKEIEQVEIQIHYDPTATSAESQ
ncbi:hypothetical protein PALB_37560 [Pseudoalteromonas luteoviolacea B = ATCC 29581]|nr:hypothetical protein PALB_37560 [Pseudoalteromonas luteoviolacea B = ATCC 29581]